MLVMPASERTSTFVILSEAENVTNTPNDLLYKLSKTLEIPEVIEITVINMRFKFQCDYNFQLVVYCVLRFLLFFLSSKTANDKLMFIVIKCVNHIIK